MAGMECDPLPACPNSKRKAAEAALDDDDGVSDGENNVAVGAAAPPPPATAAIDAVAPRRIISQAWIDSILAGEMKPLPFKERHLRDPKLAAIFDSHEQSRASFAEYQNTIRREVETKEYVKIDDDYNEMCELLDAVYDAAFYGREEDENEAMAKLAALDRRC